MRCVVCRQALPTLKLLKSHCVAAHSKMQLVTAFLKNMVKQRKSKFVRTEILYLEDGFQNSLSECESDKITAPLPKIEIKEEDDDKTEVKKEIEEEEMKKRKENLLKLRKFRFDKSLRRGMSLNEKTGLFYSCRCSETEKRDNIVEYYRKSDLQNLASDTDTCSDTESNFYVPFADLKLYCAICGNGYTSKKKLKEHLKIHNTDCHICNKRFKDKLTYKEHMKQHLLKVFVCHLCGAEFGLKIMLMDHLDAHIEDDVYENVFGLERDYKIEGGGYFGVYPFFYFG